MAGFTSLNRKSIEASSRKAKKPTIQLKGESPAEASSTSPVHWWLGSVHFVKLHACSLKSLSAIWVHSCSW